MVNHFTLGSSPGISGCRRSLSRELSARAPLPTSTSIHRYRRHLSTASGKDQDSSVDQEHGNTSQPRSHDDDRFENPSSLSTYGPSEAIVWGGTLPSARRAILGTALGFGIALGGNLGGITSFLLGLDGGKLASTTRLDVLIPVRGYKRCLDYQNGYEFLYPASWLADQQLYRRYAARVERERPLDPPPLRPSASPPPRRDTAEPTAAFGPPGSSGEDNVSVIVAPIPQGFRLEKLGTPEEAATHFLETTVAPPSSNRVARLMDAKSRHDADGQLYYVMEFTVELPGKFSRHNVAIYGSRNGLLYSLNAQSRESAWNAQRAEQYYKAVDSFRIF